MIFMNGSIMENKGMLVKVMCEVCGLEMNEESHTYNKVKIKKFFCSDDCYDKFQSNKKDLRITRKKRIILECSICGKKIWTAPYYANKEIRKFCSKECHSEWNSQNLNGENNGNFNSILLKCDYCGKEKYHPVYRTIEYKKHFCDTKCMGKWQSENLSGENARSWNGGQVKRICETCNKEFYIEVNRLKSGRGRFCSISCYATWQSIYRIKEKSFAWNPEISETKRVTSRQYNEYFNWRNDVYKRDNYICQHCGIRGGDLNAHHIIPFSKDKSLRTEISNGITLCKKCHKKEHERLRKLKSENYDLFII